MQTNYSASELTFIKLGGSLITEKSRQRTSQRAVLERLAEEIAQAYQRRSRLQVLLGHGSGSFGHVPAKKYGTRQGVRTPEEWAGFATVWREAAALNWLVMQALHVKGLPAVAFPPSASVTAKNGVVASWDINPIRAALQAGLLPVVYGDVVFDSHRGGTILSTEDLFTHLARQLKPKRILLFGLEPGVWADYPQCQQLISEITPQNFDDVLPVLHGSKAVDVTGGMLSKVQQSLAMTAEIQGLEVFILSGEQPGLLERSLAGEPLGTCIHS